jgi:hypothetical protein
MRLYQAAQANKTTRSGRDLETDLPVKRWLYEGITARHALGGFRGFLTRWDIPANDPEPVLWSGYHEAPRRPDGSYLDEEPLFAKSPEDPGVNDGLLTRGPWLWMAHMERVPDSDWTVERLLVQALLSRDGGQQALVDIICDCSPGKTFRWACRPEDIGWFDLLDGDAQAQVIERSKSWFSMPRRKRF